MTNFISLVMVEKKFSSFLVGEILQGRRVYTI